MNRLLSLMLGGFLCSIVSVLILSAGKKTIVYANEVAEEGNGYFSLMEKISEDDDKVLHDNIKYISEVVDESNISGVDDTENDSYDTENDSAGEDMNSMNEFQIMVIFSFGLLVGVIVGHFLTGFIK